MKILVPVKRVVDYNVRVRPKPDHSDVDLVNAKMDINPFCDIAVEEAVRLKEQGIASEIVVVSIGDAKSEEQIRRSLGMGADRGILITHDTTVSSLTVAKLLAAVVKDEEPALIILGKQSIDTDNNQTGQMLAALLQCSQGTFASKLVVDGETVLVTRELDGGLQTLRLTLPAVVTTDLRLNQPRYIKLPDIMKAKRKPLDKKSLSDYGIEDKQTVNVLKVDIPPQRKAGIKVATVAELVDKLKNEARVLP